MSTFHISVYAADKVFFEGEGESLILPTVNGLYGILPHHRNVISAILPGMLTLRTPDGNVHIAAVSNGLVKVENNSILVLVDSAERPEEIDINRARKARDRAKEELLQKKSLQEYRAAEANLARAINRLRVKSDAQK